MKRLFVLVFILALVAVFGACSHDKMPPETIAPVVTAAPSYDPAEKVKFSSEVFERVFREKYKISGPITRGMLLEFTELDLSCDAFILDGPSYGGAGELRKIDDVAYFANLQSLNLENNNIRDASAISTLTKLTSLNLNLNCISYLSWLKPLTALTELEISSNRLKQLDGIEYAQNLMVLDITGNPVKDPAPLKMLPSLIELDASLIVFDDLTPLKSLTNLKKLSFDIRQGTDISPIKKCTELTELIIRASCIGITDYDDFTPVYVDFKPLRGLTKLTKLHLEGVSIDPAALGKLTELTTLFAYFEHGANLKPLDKLESLVELYVVIFDSEADFSALAELTNLSVFGCGWFGCGDITEFAESLAKADSLEYIHLYFYSLTDITPLKQLAALKNLKELHVYSPGITADQLDELRNALPNCKIS